MNTSMVTLADIFTGTSPASPLLILLATIVLFVVIYSGILIFHWFAYSLHTRVAAITTAVYVVIGLVFLVALLSHAHALLTL